MKLSSEILAWDFDDESSRGLNLELRQRAHEIWRHARERLNGEPTEFDRTDSVCALKRAVNHRLKSLHLIHLIAYLTQATVKIKF